MNQIAVYFDGDNVSYKDANIIVNEIKNYGSIIFSKVYGDWSQENMKTWQQTASNIGAIPIQCDRISGKNSSDLKICVDIMKDLYTIDNITLFYIITSDSDFRHIVPEIKTKNKKVNCIGYNNANISLKSICDTYTKIDVLKGKNNKPRKQLNKNFYKEQIKEIIIGMDKDIVNISMIKEILTRKYQFDLREWQYAKMSYFIIDNFSNDFNIIRDNKGMSISLKD